MQYSTMDPNKQAATIALPVQLLSPLTGNLQLCKVHRPPDQASLHCTVSNKVSNIELYSLTNALPLT